MEKFSRWLQSLMKPQLRAFSLARQRLKRLNFRYMRTFMCARVRHI